MAPTVLVRRDLCKIRKIDNFDKISCWRRFSLRLANLTGAGTSAGTGASDSIEGHDPDPAAPASANCVTPDCTVKRSLDGRAAICCMPGNTTAEQKDPKTGKIEMTCVPEACPAGQIVTKKMDPTTRKELTSCACPSGQTATKKTDPKTKKVVVTCNCAAGQTATTKVDPKTKKSVTTCAPGGGANKCPAGRKSVQTKDRRTGKFMNTCTPVKVGPTKCAKGQKAAQRKDPKTGRVTTVCMPNAAGQKTPPVAAPKAPPKAPPKTQTTKKKGPRGILY